MNVLKPFVKTSNGTLKYTKRYNGRIYRCKGRKLTVTEGLKIMFDHPFLEAILLGKGEMFSWHIIFLHKNGKTTIK